MDSYLVVIITGFLVAFTLTPVVRWLATYFGVIDKPDARRPHKRPTARGGGVAVVVGVHVACLLSLWLFWENPEANINRNWWGHYVVATLILLVVGVIDDVRGMRPKVKLCGQILAAMVMCHAGTRFGLFLGFELPWLLDCAMVVFWMVAIINAFNLIDGLDGLASGLTIISATGLCGVFFVLGHVSGSMVVLVALIGACLGFLRYNFHPATVFLGDTGSMFLGFSLGAVSLNTFNKSTLLVSMVIPMMVLGVPIYDAVLAIWRRSVRLWLPTTNTDGIAKKRGIMQPDVEHLHHRLLRMGLSTPRVATLLFVVNLVLVLCGLMLAMFQSHAAGIFLLALLAGVYILMRHMAVIELQETGRLILTGLRRPSHMTLKALSFPFWDMFCMAASLAVVMWLVESVQIRFWHTWFLDLPVWVTPTFSLLAVSRTYITVWPRARIYDILILILTLLTGLMISLGIALLIDPSEASRWFVRAIIIGGLSHPAIIGSRMFYRVVEELVIHFKASSNPNATERTLLYGAGVRCHLFLRERGFSNSSSYVGSVIVGLIDDEPALHYQWVYGYLVLGASKDLPQLVTRHRATRVIITAALRPEALLKIQELAREHHFRLSEWRFEDRQLVTYA